MLSTTYVIKPFMNECDRDRGFRVIILSLRESSPRPRPMSSNLWRHSVFPRLRPRPRLPLCWLGGSQISDGLGRPVATAIANANVSRVDGSSCVSVSPMCDRASWHISVSGAHIRSGSTGRSAWNIPIRSTSSGSVRNGGRGSNHSRRCSGSSH